MTSQYPGDQQIEQELATLKKQYDQLKERKVRTEQNLENIKKQLADLEEQAMQEFGSSDPADLEQILERKRQENAELVRRYKEHIQSVSNDLAKLESEDA